MQNTLQSPLLISLSWIVAVDSLPRIVSLDSLSNTSPGFSTHDEHQKFAPEESAAAGDEGRDHDERRAAHDDAGARPVEVHAESVHMLVHVFVEANPQADGENGRACALKARKGR